MKSIVGVRFKKPGKIYFFDPNGLNINKDDFVIVETTRGLEYGEVAIPNRVLPEEKISHELKPVVRIATKEDKAHVEDIKKKEKEAFNLCLKKIKYHKLDMKLIDCEYTFDNSKLLFYFSAEGRIDFRDLVKDLANVFKTRIELRQIGVRDEVKRIGGNGVCGRELCCCSFLGNFEPVSIKMAKEQNLSLNPSKISGNCGRLMCCLKYEHDVYEEKLSRLPKTGAIVKTVDGKGVVDRVEILREKLRVKFQNGEDVSFKTYDASEVKVLQKGHKEEKDDIIDSEELRKLEEESNKE